jgi:hypothetical protein
MQIRNSNLKKQQFSEYVQLYFAKDYQLLRDVVIRWSSTLLMISRVLKLKDVNSATHMVHTFTDKNYRQSMT